MATSISLWLQFFTLLIYIVFLKVHCLGVNCAALLHGKVCDADGPAFSWTASIHLKLKSCISRIQDAA